MPRPTLPASLVLFLALLGSGACGGRDAETSGTDRAAGTAAAPAEADSAAATREDSVTMAFQISTPAFAPEQPIPTPFTCDGEDHSPALTWSGAPENTQTFALICDDPDAPMGTWVHWTIFNIPGSASGLPEGITDTDGLADGTIQGRNSWRRVGYGGPCPPPGKPHRYFFKLYALDTTLELDSRAGKKDLLAAMEGHILATAQVMGTYKR